MLGVTRKTYGDWESPKSPKVPNDPNKLIALCEILDTSIDYLYCGVYESSREETHQNVYLTIYDRYKEDEDFKFLLRYLMGMPRSAILLLGKTIESLDEHFSGAEEF